MSKLNKVWSVLLLLLLLLLLVFRQYLWKFSERSLVGRNINRCLNFRSPNCFEPLSWINPCKVFWFSAFNMENRNGVRIHDEHTPRKWSGVGEDWWVESDTFSNYFLFRSCSRCARLPNNNNNNNTHFGSPRQSWVVIFALRHHASDYLCLYYNSHIHY